MLLRQILKVIKEIDTPSHYDGDLKKVDVKGDDKDFIKVLAESLASLERRK